jgi:hypothetical protein
LWSAPVQRMVRSIQIQADETEMFHEVDHVCGAAQNDEVHILKTFSKGFTTEVVLRVIQNGD